MESLLWAVNLSAVVYLCFWGIAQDDKEKQQSDKKESKGK